MGKNPRSQRKRTHRHTDYTASTPILDEDGLLAMVEKLDESPFLLILDEINDPHNLGACLRTAAAAGMHAVVVPKDHSVSMTETVRRIACGAAEIVPVVRVTNLARTMKQLQKAGVWLVGAAGEAPDSLYGTDLTGPLAIVMGSEGSGLRRLTRENCDYVVSIPMSGAVESLNVSVAAGIFLFEAVRQRKKFSP